jgi:hypothetical protein
MHYSAYTISHPKTPRICLRLSSVVGLELDPGGI